MPDWLRVDVERRSFANSRRRLGRPFRRARERALNSAWIWGAAAAVSPAAAVVADEKGWLLFGAAAVVQAGLSVREYRTTPAGGLPAPLVAPLRALELRRSAAARPLRRGEAGLAALAALLGSVEGPAAVQVAESTRTAVRLVDGLRSTARRVLACESALRAVSGQARRAEIQAASAQLLTGMEQAADLLEELVALATGIVGAVAVAAAEPELDRLAEDVERLRNYADGLSELLGTGGSGSPA
ncbi:phage shock envelope stress response protein PspM [Frankia sp. EI5c]|uniref:phage shock envelope stress response protein PspM n=1 Tax=Frankia sp. EI5c TaxID=683316 RepID=UPI0008246CD7|nr:hypothetical protein [Frankia sp. EI5c]